ncbi:MAG: DUF4249 domain-containing protein [Bacteroidales bacterium]|nr:DUF4249 domain-containing protein [Bacteroidales bacterium]
MKRNIFLLPVILCLLGIAVTGCEKIVEFDVDEVTPYVVAISRPEADSAVNINLSYSRFFLDGHPFRKISGADLRLFSNGSQANLLSTDEGQYLFDCRPQAGDSLAFHLFVPSYPMMQAGTRVPAEPDYEVETLYDSVAKFCQVKVRINDPKGRNYYRISFDGWTREWSPASDTIPKPYSMDFSTSDIVFTDATSIDYMLDQGETTVYGSKLRFSDALFDGKSHTMVFNIYFWDMNDFLKDPNYPYYVRLTSLSQERYRYENTIEQYNNNEFSFLSEPTQIYTNVQGGIGIFAASNTKKIEMKPTFTQLQPQY